MTQSSPHATAAPRDLAFEGVDPAVLAGAIRSYVRHPGVRHAIGTAAEQQRLHGERGQGGYGLPPLPGPASARTTAIRAATGVVLLSSAFTLQTGLESLDPHWSLFTLLPSLLGLHQLRRA